MAQDTSDIAKDLWSITADLRPITAASADALHQARIVLASALAAGETSVVARAASPTTQTPAELTPGHPLLQSAIQESSHSSPDDSAFVIARREVPLAITGLSETGPGAVAGQAIDRTLGPFLDPLGRPVWIDLFRIVREVRLVRVAGGTPFLTLPIRGFLGSGNSYELGPGSVWISSQQLAGAAPASSYTGLLIRGGSVKFGSSLPHSGSEIVVPPTVSCTLELELNPGTAPTGSGAGQDARLSEAKLPEKATFLFAHGGAGVEFVSRGSLRIYGSAVEAEVVTGVATYDGSLQQILYRAKTDATSFAIKDVRSDQFVPAGEAKIREVAWALPVAVTSAASLGSAAGAGSFAVFLEAGLSAAWKGQANPIPAGPVVVLVAPGFVTVVALQALGLGTKESVPLWSAHPGDAPSAQLTLGWKSAFALRFFSSSSGSEILAMLGALDGNFDRPLTVNSRRVYVHSDLALILFVENATFTGLIVEAALQPPPVSPNAPLAFSIANAVFRTTQATSLILVAAFDGVQAKSGGLALGFGLQYLLPILPDPYAANFDLPARRLNDLTTVGAFSAIVLWTPTASPVLNYTLPANATTALLGAGSNAALNTLAVSPAAAASGNLGAVVLLDLSTNVDQFGVAWRTNPFVRDAGANAPAGASALKVDSMYLESPSNSVFVLTVPSVLWEPVYTDPAPSPPYPAGYPSPISFPNSGGPTLIGVQSVSLVRIAPAPALDSLVGNFTTSPTPAQALARLTLPFGMEAVATLNKPTNPLLRGANVAYNRPTFTAESVTGGYQISLNAIDPMHPDSPGFEGSTTQLRNALFNGAPTSPPMSILGPSVDTIFNLYLGSGASTALVPVTRLDLSGYGESLFSNWRDETTNITAVSKARFDVIVGRTSVEVVQVRSILYPYAVRVVRTITIERKNTGVVTRHDSGWQAASDGAYAFPLGSLTVHPGVVQKIVNVVNIRDTGQFIDVGGAEVAGVYFDGDLILDGITKGAGQNGVPARNQIGYVQLTPESSGGPLTPLQYQQLIQKAGPLGGGIDCVVNVATSGLMMKLGRVGVGVTEGMGGPEFVMTAWGSPQFPSGGQWSFLKQTGAGTAPELVHTDLGVPLIRAGAVPIPPPPNSPYRFADPVDLAAPASPASDYGIVHATGTQRVFFPRPKIEANAPHAITSAVTPVLADPYSLANSVGLFPRTDAAIPFPNANYALDIGADGAIKLQLPSPSFPVTVGQRTITDTGEVRSYADYTGSTATVAIDTAAAVPWSFQLKNVAGAMSSTSMGEIMRIVGDLNADATSPTTLANTQVVFGGALGVVQDVMKFLQALGFPMPMSVAMTNGLELKMSLKIPMDDELNKLMPPCGMSFQDTDVTVGMTIDLETGETGAEFEAGAAIFIPTPFCTCVPAVPPDEPHIAGLQGVGLLKFNAKINTKVGQVITLTVGAGIGVTLKLTDEIKAIAYYVETEFLIFGDVFGLGVGALLKGSIDFGIISADVSIEAKMAVLRVDPSPTCAAVTVWGAAQVTIAIDITIAWVIDIDFEWQTEWSRNLNGGPCELPDVL